MEENGKELAKKLVGKEASTPSRAWRLLSSAKPEAILFLDVTSRQQAVSEKIKNYFGKWRQVQQKLPLPEMAEMRITPQLAEYPKIAEEAFLLLLDGKLRNHTEIVKFLKPYEPPPPPPPPPARRRGAKAAAAKAAGRRGGYGCRAKRGRKPKDAAAPVAPVQPPTQEAAKTVGAKPAVESRVEKVETKVKPAPAPKSRPQTATAGKSQPAKKIAKPQAAKPAAQKKPAPAKPVEKKTSAAKKPDKAKAPATKPAKHK